MENSTSATPNTELSLRHWKTQLGRSKYLISTSTKCLTQIFPSRWFDSSDLHGTVMPSHSSMFPPSVERPTSQHSSEAISFPVNASEEQVESSGASVPRRSTRNTNTNFSSGQAQMEQAPNAAPALRRSARIRNQVASGTKGATSKGAHVTKPKKDHQRAQHYQRVQGDSGRMNRYWSQPPQVALY